MIPNCHNLYKGKSNRMNEQSTLKYYGGYGGKHVNCYEEVTTVVCMNTGQITTEAFNCWHSLQNITIPHTVTTLGDRVFSWCTSLTSIALPSTITAIGSHVFYGCESLTSVTLPSTITTLGDFSFCGCSSLTSLTLPYYHDPW